MKNLLVLVALLIAMATTCFAQKGPNMFASGKEAKTAYENKEFSYYQPKYFSNHDVDPTDGVNKYTAALTQDAVVEMITANGKKFVIQPAGAIFRWKKGSDVPYARDDCGNKTFYFSYIGEYKVETIKKKNKNPDDYAVREEPKEEEKVEEVEKPQQRSSTIGSETVTVGYGITTYPTYSWGSWGGYNSGYYNNKARVGWGFSQQTSGSTTATNTNPPSRRKRQGRTIVH